MDVTGKPLCSAGIITSPTALVLHSENSNSVSLFINLYV